MDCRYILLMLIIWARLAGSSKNKTENETESKMNTHFQTEILVNLSGTNCSTNCSNTSTSNTFAPRPKMPGSATFWSLLHITNKLIAVVSAMAIVTNSFLILVILIDPLKRLQKFKSTIIILSVALSDLLTGVASIFYGIPLSPAFSFRIIFDATSVGYTVSLFTLLVFTLERFVATIYPLRIKQIVTLRKTLLACFLAWVFGIVVGTNGFYSKRGPILEKRRIARIAVLEAVVIIMVVLNIGMIVTLQKQAKRFKKIRSSLSIQRKQRKMNAVLTSLIILFIITALPFLVVTHMYHILILSGPLDPDNSLHSFVRIFPRLFFPFGLLNYVLNPIIYAWRLRDYRCSVVALCYKKSLRKKWIQESTRSGSTKKLSFLGFT